MKQERQIEELAKIDGLMVCGNCGEEANKILYRKCNHCGYIFPMIRDYLSDHNATQRVIDAMDANTLSAYHMELIAIFGRDSGSNCLWATCEHKTEAILRAYNKWEEKADE